MRVDLLQHASRVPQAKAKHKRGDPPSISFPALLSASRPSSSFAARLGEEDAQALIGSAKPGGRAKGKAQKVSLPRRVGILR